jgi:hypothetical protein
MTNEDLIWIDDKPSNEMIVKTLKYLGLKHCQDRLEQIEERRLELKEMMDQLWDDIEVASSGQMDKLIVTANRIDSKISDL